MLCILYQFQHLEDAYVFLCRTADYLTTDYYISYLPLVEVGGFEPPSSLPILLDVNNISILFISSVCSAVNLRLPRRLESFFPVASFMITPYPAEVAF